VGSILLIHIVSYYTALYQFEAENLEKSLTKFLPNISFSIEERPDSGNWEINTHYKAIFIKEKLTQPIVWADADSQMKQYPKLFDNIDCDFAAHWFKDEELISATMYWNNTPKAHELLDSWIHLNKVFPKNWDQVNLQNALKDINDIKVVRLPPEYNFITDLSREHYGNLKPVFEQYQASRKYKKRLNRS
jgi:hypothetical protein